MARGDLTVFNQFLISIGEKLINLETDTIKIGLVNNSPTAPTVDQADPLWTTYSANEVSTAGGYVAGGFTLTAPELVRVAAVATFKGTADLSLLQDAGGFTDAYWAVIYSDTAAAKNCIAFIDLGGPLSEQAGPISINWNASGILTLTRT